MSCRYVFLACPTEMLPTLRLKIGRLPILRGSVQLRLVMFMTGLFALKYGRLAFTAFLEVESWYLIKTGWQVLQDKTVTVKDKKGSTSCKDSQQDGFQVSRTSVRIQSHGGLVKYQTCLILGWLRQCGKLQPTLTDSVNIASGSV